MRKFVLYILLFSFLGFIPGLSAATEGDKPLMVIRFNNNIVDYDKILDKAVKVVLRTNAETSFNLVALLPPVSDKSSAISNDAEVKFHIEKITSQIEQAGVAADKIHTSFKPSKFIKNNEIQIFVE